MCVAIHIVGLTCTESTVDFMSCLVQAVCRSNCMRADKDTCQEGPAVKGWRRLRRGTVHHSLTRTCEIKSVMIRSKSQSGIIQSLHYSSTAGVKQHIYLFSVKKDVKCCRSSSANVCKFSPLQEGKKTVVFISSRTTQILQRCLLMACWCGCLTPPGSAVNTCDAAACEPHPPSCDRSGTVSSTSPHEACRRVRDSFKNSSSQSFISALQFSMCDAFTFLSNKKTMQNVLTFYHQSSSSSQLSPGQAQRSRKKRSACHDRKWYDHGNSLINKYGSSSRAGVLPSVHLLRKPWEWKVEQAAGKMSRKAWMVVVESHRYRISSASSCEGKQNTQIQLLVTSESN